MAATPRAAPGRPVCLRHGRRAPLGKRDAVKQAHDALAHRARVVERVRIKVRGRAERVAEPVAHTDRSVPAAPVQLCERLSKSATGTPRRSTRSAWMLSVPAATSLSTRQSASASKPAAFGALTLQSISACGSAHGSARAGVYVVQATSASASRAGARRDSVRMPRTLAQVVLESIARNGSANRAAQGGGRWEQATRTREYPQHVQRTLDDAARCEPPELVANRLVG